MSLGRLKLTEGLGDLRDAAALSRKQPGTRLSHKYVGVGLIICPTAKLTNLVQDLLSARRYAWIPDAAIFGEDILASRRANEKIIAALFENDRISGIKAQHPPNLSRYSNLSFTGYLGLSLH